MTFYGFCRYFATVAKVPDADTCRQKYKILFLQFYTNIKVIEGFGHGGNFMSMAFMCRKVYKATYSVAQIIQLN